MTPEYLVEALGCPRALAERYAQHLEFACQTYGIDTRLRREHFLAQVAHESGGLRYVKELWGPTPAQLRYEGRRDLGNTERGDGFRYRGRGLIQTTGRFNYRRVTERLRSRFANCPDFEAEPESLEREPWSVLSAADYWDMRGCNAAADEDDLERVTRLVNGGLNGLADRRRRLERIRGIKVEVGMTPFVAAALPAILDAVPKLVGIFKGESQVSERNAQAAEVVVGIAKEALGARNEQEVVERLEVDPEAKKVVQQAVEEKWFQVYESAEKSIDKAREHAMVYSRMQDVRTVVGRFTFIEVLTLVFLGTCWGSIGLLASFDKIGQETLDMVVTVAVIASIVGIREFWYGSSYGSRLKDERGNTNA